VKLLAVSLENRSYSLLHQLRLFRLRDSLHQFSVLLPQISLLSTVSTSLLLFSRSFSAPFSSHYSREVFSPYCNLQPLSPYPDSNLLFIHRRVDNLLVRSTLDFLPSYSRLKQIRLLISYLVAPLQLALHDLAPSTWTFTYAACCHILSFASDLRRILSSFSSLQHLHTFLPHLTLQSLHSMSNQPPHDPRFSGNMVPSQSGTYDYRVPRPYHQTTGRSGAINSQRPSPSPQMINTPSWNSPALAAQYYGYPQSAPEDPYFDSNSFMPPRQTAQSYASMSFDNPSHQAQFDPAAQMLQNWTSAQSVYGSGTQHAGQQYPVQQTQMYQTPFQQTTYQQTSVQPAQVQSQTDYQEDAKTTNAYSGDYDNFNMEDDPSTQLMAELNQDIPESAYSPTPAPEAVDNKCDDLDQAWGDSVVDAAMAELNNSPTYAPQNTQSDECETFRSFEYETPINEAQKAQDEELAQQVDQVVAGLSDEDMDDDMPGEQIEIVRT
jgi:hypothetical protein